MPRHFWPVLVLLIGLLVAGFIPIFNPLNATQAASAQAVLTPQPGAGNQQATAVVPNTGMPENSPAWLPGVIFLMLIAILMVGAVIFLMFGGGSR